MPFLPIFVNVAEHQHIILFDGVCNLCNGSVQFILRFDRQKKFKFAALQSDIATELLGMPIAPEGYDSFIYLRHGQLLQRSTAALNVLRDLGVPWNFFYLFIFLPCILRDGVYRFMAKNRYRLFGKRSTCMIPTPDIRSRFL